MKKITSLAGVILVLLIMFTAVPSRGSALSGSDYPDGRIIDEDIFTNKNSMSVQEIQAFFESKVNGGSCDRNRASSNPSNQPPYTCLYEFIQNPTTRENNYGKFNGDGSPAAVPGGWSAAQIVWQAAQDYDINPQVLIVLMQKEKGLVTDNWPWTRQYSQATGYNCPDTAPCDPDKADFSKQVRGAAWSFRYYMTNNGLWYPVGSNNILYNPNQACGTKPVNIESLPTSALHLYTPYTPNQAALDNLYGTGDSCSAYGNRNFWRYFNDWFGNTHSSPFFRINGGPKVYILGADDSYYHIASSEVLAAYGYGRIANRVENYSSSYISGKTFSGLMPRTARFESSTIYLIDDGRKIRFPSRELYEDTYGYTLGEEASLSSGYANLFTTSESMQFVIEQRGSSLKYFVEDGLRKPFYDQQAYMSGSPSYSSMLTVSLTEDYISTLPSGPRIFAQEKIIKTTEGFWYYWDNSVLQKLSTGVMNRSGLSPDYIVPPVFLSGLATSEDTISNMVYGDTGDKYLINGNTLVSISNGTAVTHNLTDFEQIDSNFIDRFPKKQFVNIFRINGSSKLYMLLDGDITTYANREIIAQNGYSISDALDFNSGVASRFTNNGKWILPTGQAFRINGDRAIYIVNTKDTYLKIPSRELFESHGLSFSNVADMSWIYITRYSNAGKLSSFIEKPSGQIWSINSGQRRLIDDQLAAEGAFDLIGDSPEFVSSYFLKFKARPKMSQVVQATGQSRVYLIEQGKKRWVTSTAALTGLGYRKADITPVNPILLVEFPLGENIN